MVPACRWEMKFCMPRNAIGVDPDSTALVVSPPPRTGCDPIGAALALEPLEVERKRQRRRGIAQRARFRLRQRDKFVHVAHVERRVDHQRLGIEEQIADRLEILGGIEPQLLVEKLARRFIACYGAT